MDRARLTQNGIMSVRGEEEVGHEQTDQVNDCVAADAGAMTYADYLTLGKGHTDDSRSGYTLYVVSKGDAYGIRDLFSNGNGTSALSALFSDKLVSWTDSDMDKKVNGTLTVDETTLNWEEDIIMPWREAKAEWGMFMITSDQTYWQFGDFLAEATFRRDVCLYCDSENGAHSNRGTLKSLCRTFYIRFLV